MTRLSRGGDTVPADQEEVFDDTDVAGEDAEDVETDAAAPTDDADDADDSQASADEGALVKEASAEAAELGVVVPEDASDCEEWVRHFITAIKSHKTTKDLQNAEQQAAAAPPAPQEQPQEEPAAVTMSITDQRVQALEKAFGDERFRTMALVVDTMQTKGQATPAQVQRWKNTLGAKRLSLLPGRTDEEVSGVLSQIEFAKELPAGAFWTPEEKAARLSKKANPADAPEHVRWDKNPDEALVTPDKVKAILDEQFGKAS